jgi:hypothetical protein
MCAAGCTGRVLRTSRIPNPIAPSRIGPDTPSLAAATNKSADRTNATESSHYLTSNLLPSPRTETRYER